MTYFKNIKAKDTKTSDTLDANLVDLPKHFDFFLPLMGVEKVEYDKESLLDQKAASRFLRVYDDLATANQNIDPKVLNLFWSGFCFAYLPRIRVFLKKIPLLPT